MNAAPAAFGERLAAVFARRGRLCVGIDPHPYLLNQWGLPDSAESAREFGLRVVEAAAAGAGIVKPQVAFFERFGAAGYQALEDVIRSARQSGLLVIADAKRGDVGTSVEAYGQAWLTPGAPLESDALTVSPFQGVGSLAAPITLALAGGKGLFVLAVNSNPEAAELQQARLRARPAQPSVSRAIIDDVTLINQREFGDAVGAIGVVLGATVRLADYGIEPAHAPAGLPVLAPGFGAQGAQLRDAPALFGALCATTIVSESRSLLSAGPSGVDAAITRRAAEVREAIG